MKIEQLGINSMQHFIEVTSTITFKRQGERWLKSLSPTSRSRPAFRLQMHPPVLPFHSGAVQFSQFGPEEGRLRIIAVSRVGALSRRPALRPERGHPITKDPVASAFWVYFESRLERYPPSTRDPLCAGRPIAF